MKFSCAQSPSGLRNAAFISAAVGSVLRLCPARRSAAAIRLTDSAGLRAGDSNGEPPGEYVQEGRVGLPQQ
jgi:hypothetical protein